MSAPSPAEIHDALDPARRRLFAAVFAMGLASAGIAAGTLFAATDTTGRVLGALLACTFAGFTAFCARELGLHARAVRGVIEQPGHVVWVTFTVQSGPRVQTLGILTVHDAAGRSRRFVLPPSTGGHAFELLREQCPQAVFTHRAGGYEALHQLWRSSPAEFPARARGLQSDSGLPDAGA
ncbi:MAG: hypothetical protein HYZ29_34955 [Myxococcales bacterium]|nr:hypothetical protein [Myxococcales bacterium]